MGEPMLAITDRIPDLTHARDRAEVLLHRAERGAEDALHRAERGAELALQRAERLRDRGRVQRRRRARRRNVLLALVAAGVVVVVVRMARRRADAQHWPGQPLSGGARRADPMPYADESVVRPDLAAAPVPPVGLDT
jgi:hypothetical protein